MTNIEEAQQDSDARKLRIPIMLAMHCQLHLSALLSRVSARLLVASDFRLFAILCLWKKSAVCARPVLEYPRVTPPLGFRFSPGIADGAY